MTIGSMKALSALPGAGKVNWTPVMRSRARPHPAKHSDDQRGEGRESGPTRRLVYRLVRP